MLHLYFGNLIFFVGDVRRENVNWPNVVTAAERRSESSYWSLAENIVLNFQSNSSSGCLDFWVHSFVFCVGSQFPEQRFYSHSQSKPPSHPKAPVWELKQPQALLRSPDGVKLLVLEEPHLDHSGVVSAHHHHCSQLVEVFVSLPTTAVVSPTREQCRWCFISCIDLRVVQSVLSSTCD